MTEAPMSICAYARCRGCSESAARYHIRSGLLVPAMTPDGKIYPSIADRLWAEGVTRASHATPKEVTASLAETKRLRLITLMRIRERTTNELRASLVERTAIPIFAAQLLEMVKSFTDDLPALLGPDAAGMPVQERLPNADGFTTLTHTLRTFILTHCEDRSRLITEFAERMALPHLPVPSPLRLDDMTMIELATEKAKLSAERASMLDRAEKGELLKWGQVDYIWRDWLARTLQTKLNYFAGLIDLHVSRATPEQAVEIIRKSVDDVYAYLALWVDRIAMDPMSEEYAA
jgi:hypothetical protein